MLIELRKGMTLHPCTFNAVIAPEKVMISVLNNNIDLHRFLFLLHTVQVALSDRNWPGSLKHHQDHTGVCSPMSLCLQWSVLSLRSP
jgi:hypothetical protein